MAHVQSTSEGSYSATTSHEIALTGVAAGNVLIVACRGASGGSNDMSSVSSSQDGAFTALSEVSNGTVRLRMFVLENASSGTHTVTGTAASTGLSFRWALLEYDNAPASGVVEFHDAFPTPKQAFYRTVQP